MHWAGGTFFVYTIILPIFMYKMGINILEAGFIFGITAILDVVLTFILSHYLDRISPNMGMALDWFTESWPAFIFAFAVTPLHFFFGTLAQKATNILNPVYRVYENEVFPKEKCETIYTYHLFTPEILRIIIFPLIGYLLTYKFTSLMAYRVLFIICGIGFLLVSIIPIKFLTKVSPFTIQKQKDYIKLPKELYLVALAEVLILVCGQLTSVLITSYFILESMNGTIMDVMILSTVTSVVVVITGLFSKNLSSRISKTKIAQFGVILFILYTGLMCIANRYWIILLATFISSIGHTIWFPNHSAILMQLVPQEKRGLFFGSLSSLSKFLTIIIPIFSGFLAKQFGFFAVFSIAFILYIFVFLIYLNLTKNVKISEV